MVSADHFRHELSRLLRSAAAQGGTTLVVTSDELCKNIRFGNSSTQACFEAMQAEAKPGDDVRVSASGAEMVICYRLPRIAQCRVDLGHCPATCFRSLDEALFRSLLICCDYHAWDISILLVVSTLFIAIKNQDASAEQSGELHRLMN
jgi:hypothetical protein